MTTDAYLWAILALLSVALVLVIVTARRGPWQYPSSTITGPHFEQGDVGSAITGPGIPPGTFVAQVTGPNTAVLSKQVRLRRWHYWRIRRVKP